MIRRILEAETDADVMAVSGTAVADRRGRPLVDGEELSRIYKRVARSVHPDKTMASEGSVEAFQRLRGAYERLVRRVRAPADAERLGSEVSDDDETDQETDEATASDCSDDDIFELSPSTSGEEDSLVDTEDSSCASAES